MLPCWLKVAEHPRTVWVIHDQCMSGLKVPDIHNGGEPMLVVKSTCFMASRKCLVQALDQRCTHDHAKIPHGVIEGNYKGKTISSMAQAWPAMLCRKICTGVQRAIQEQKTTRKAYPASSSSDAEPMFPACKACTKW